MAPADSSNLKKLTQLLRSRLARTKPQPYLPLLGTTKLSLRVWPLSVTHAIAETTPAGSFKRNKLNTERQLRAKR